MVEHEIEFDEYYFKLEEWLTTISTSNLDIDSVKKYIELYSCLILKIPSETETSKAVVREFLENIDNGRKELTANSYSMDSNAGRICSQMAIPLIYVCDRPCNTCLVAICEKVWRYC